MEEITVRVNIDFELQVKKKTILPLKPLWEREWEYLLWWVENQNYVLSKSRKVFYEKKDLDYIEKITGRKKFFSETQGQDIKNWWGNPLLENLDKTDLPKMRKDIFHDESSFVGSPQNFPCVAKRDGAFSGKGVYFLKEREDFKSLPPDRYVIEPMREIVKNFSSYYDQGQLIFYETLVDKKGGYEGSFFGEDFNWLSDEVYKGREKIQAYLKKKNAHYYYGIDSYFYDEKGQIKLEHLCEINCRKTLAFCAYKIYKNFFSNFSYGKNLLIEKRKVKKLKDYPSEQVVRLSPHHNQYFIHLLILEDTPQKMEQLTTKVYKFFGLL